MTYWIIVLSIVEVNKYGTVSYIYAGYASDGESILIESFLFVFVILRHGLIL